MKRNIANLTIFSKTKLLVLDCLFISLIGSISQVSAADNLAGSVLRDLSTNYFADTEVDSANTRSLQLKSAPSVVAAESEPPMQTIDSDSTKMTELETPNTESPPSKTTDSGASNTESPPSKTTEPATTKLIEPETQITEPEATTQSIPKKDIGEKAAHFATHLPERLGFFTANVIVAAPATFVRHSAQYTVSNTKELIGDHKNPLLLVPAGTLSLYYGLTSGLVEGTVLGVVNSWKHSADGHISKASLGLEESK